MDEVQNQAQEAEAVQENNQEEIQEENVTAEDQMKEQLSQVQDKYIRLAAEFDNYRKRTNKEKIDLINSASERVILSVLEVLDDIDRASDQMKSTDDIESLRTGAQLIFDKLRKSLQGHGLKEMESTGEEFNLDLHEAITEIPAPKKKQVGKVMDTIQKGYYINDKIIRHAKVVVGK